MLTVQIFFIRQVPTLSIILLTHATPAHIAAFAHCCKHFPLFTRIPIYATTPVISLGRTLLQDLYASTPLASTTIPASSLSETSYSHTSPLSYGDGPQLLLQPPTPEEIAAYFSLIHPLKYSQPHQPLPSPFSPPLNGLTITAYNAGHTLGGTIWHIQHGLESIVYAVDWNQARENVLAGAAWLGGAGAGGAEVIEQLRKPTALVCSTRGAERVALPGGRKKRDELLLDMVRATVAKGGTVLIPTDSSARVLELAYLLEHAWRTESSRVDEPSALRTARLYLASKNIGATMRYARSMLEWMDEGIVKEFEAEGSGGTEPRQNRGGNQQNAVKDSQSSNKSTGPFDFKYLRLLERKSQVDRILNATDEGDGQRSGQVIVASDTSLAWGFSKDILQRIASDSRNLVILTERVGSAETDFALNGGVLGCVLWDWWEERRDGVAMEIGSDGENLEQVYGGGREIQFKKPRRTALEGNEVYMYQQYLATQRQLQNTLQSGNQGALISSTDAIDDSSSTSSSSSGESDSERQGKALNISTAMAHSNRSKLNLTNEDLGINVLLRGKGVYDYDVRGKRGRERMFPAVVRRVRNDEFGELIRPEEYLRAEERDEVEGQDTAVSGYVKADSENTVGKKRKWNDLGSQDRLGRRVGSVVRRGSNGMNKRRQGEGGRILNVANNEPDGIERDSSGAPEDSETSDDGLDDELLATGPSKVTYTTETLRCNLKIAFVDFAGLHDNRSLRMLIPLIQPRKLILVGGMKDETLTLAEDCRKLLGARSGDSTEAGAVDVFTPIVGRTVDASVDTNAWVVKLSEPLVKRLHWQKVRGLGVVHVTGRLALMSVDDNQSESQEGSSNKKRKTIRDESESPRVEELQPASQQDSKVTPTLDVIPTSMAAATRSVAQPIHVGDLRLADLRKLLQGSGHTAEFRGEGTLLIDGLIAVRKTGTGRIEIEACGGLAIRPNHFRGRGSEGVFHAVKKKIYEGLAVVASG
jgi:cleavage and polyadenylation specificity factor subunit 2